MRLARSAASGRLRVRTAAALLLLALFAVGCGGGTSPEDIAVTWSLEPAPPQAGEPTRVVLTLKDASGRPVEGAQLSIDAQMDHPGMAPVLGTAKESTAGVYEAPLTFSMNGDWVLVASGTLKDGARFSRSLDVSNVQ